MNSNYPEKFISICEKKKLTVNIAESCTGGLISSNITSVANASKVLNFCIVTYSDQSKINFLSVPPKIISKYGAVSKETVLHMTRGLTKYKNADFFISVTGIAGPTGGTEHKPVGLVFFSFKLLKNDIIIEKKFFKGDRNKIRYEAANFALKYSVSIINSLI